MTDFLDIAGASGTRYRFRRARLDALPANAGNVVVVSERTSTPQLCATATSISQAADTLRTALAGVSGGRLFVRLNVVRAVRDAEQADIVAAAGPIQVLSDLG